MAAVHVAMTLICADTVGNLGSLRSTCKVHLIMTIQMFCRKKVFENARQIWFLVAAHLSSCHGGCRHDDAPRPAASIDAFPELGSS